MTGRGAAVDRVIAALNAKGRQPNREGAGWKALCPVHDDHEPSLGITQDAKGARVRCWSQQCPLDEIVAALGLVRSDLLDAPQKQQNGAGEWTPSGEAVAVYDYTDEAGTLLFQVLRTADKKFAQRRPDPASRTGWRWKLNGVRRVPYRLPQLVEAAQRGETIWVAEGEKDVQALVRAGVTATCNPGGAGKWRAEYDHYFAGADVKVIRDKDDAGRKHALHVAEGLRQAGATVQIIEALEGKDAADHLAAGHGLDTFSVIQSEPASRDAAERERAGEDSDTGRGPSQATRLRQLAHERFRLVCGDDGKPYAVAKDGPNIVRPLRGKAGLRNLLAKMYADAFGSVPSQSALTDASTALEGDADSADVEPVYLRVAPYEGGVVLDLGTPDGRCVIVTPGQGWRRVPKSPVLFRRTRLIGVMPDPLDGGTLDGFRGLFNVDDYQWPLVVGWLAAALIPDIPHPILSILGEQGTAKSSAAKMLVLLVDSSAAPLRTQPRDLKSWATQAAASWTVCLDNVSSIQPWLSDALCRAATGDGLVDRMLYSDDDVNVLSFRRVVALTAIGTDALRGDLAERLVPVDLARIGSDSRRAEAEVMRLFEDARPQALGALLTLLSKVLGKLPDIRLDKMPRMADFARVLAALDHATGWDSLNAYELTAEEVAESVIESDHFAEHLRGFMDKLGPDPWRGTVGQLFELITPEKPPKKWPETVQGARTELRRVAPALRMRGYTVEPLQRTGKARPWILASPAMEKQIESERKTSSQSSSSSPDADGLRKRDDDGCDDARAAGASSLASSQPKTASDLRESRRGDDSDDTDDASPQLSPTYPDGWPDDDMGEWAS